LVTGVLGQPVGTVFQGSYTAWL